MGKKGDRRMSVMDKIKDLRKRMPNNRRTSTKGIFLRWQEGDNVVRLVGEFLETKTHYVKGNVKRGERGLLVSEAFSGDDRLPPVLNCLDWDLDEEKPTEERTCPICHLNRLAKKALNEFPAINNEEYTMEDRQFLEQLLSSTRARTALKWNVIDRNDPFVIVDDGNTETKALGLKIATIGMEAWGDIEGIFNQIGYDITDPEKGIDIVVEKGNNGARVVYSAKAVLEGLSIKVTPLTEEERALNVLDLRQICGKMIEREKILDALHGDLREMVEINDSESEQTETKSAPKSAPKNVEKDDEEDPDDPISGSGKKKVEEQIEKDKKELDVTSFACFGSIDGNHPECKDCPGKEECAKESGVELN